MPSGLLICPFVSGLYEKDTAVCFFRSLTCGQPDDRQTRPGFHLVEPAGTADLCRLATESASPPPHAHTCSQTSTRIHACIPKENGAGLFHSVNAHTCSLTSSDNPTHECWLAVGPLVCAAGPLNSCHVLVRLGTHLEKKWASEAPTGLVPSDHFPLLFTLSANYDFRAWR